MSLSSGTRIGAFEIIGLLGKGGMGEVYRARDTKLGREVAIKVLPEEVAADGDYLARFEREARLLASLSHPNIGALYDFQEADGVRFLVLEIIEGETLGERIARGPMPIREAIPIFVQIAQGLEAAHAAGIVHRDLKPANIKITPDDTVKILDFGIAKSTEGHRAPGTPTPTQTGQSDPNAATLPGTPTPPTNLTAEDMLVGTPSYMSPEQARGKPVDKRSDIWAFGCCLFEALTGTQPYSGDTVADTIAAILEHEPKLDRLPANVPSEIVRLIRRCMEKDPKRRLSSASDIAITLEEAAETIKRDSQTRQAPESVEPAGAGGAIPTWGKVAGTIVALAVVAAIAYVLGRPDIVLEPTGTTELSPITSLAAFPKPVRRFDIPIQHTLNMGTYKPFELSRDGTKLVYVGRGANGERVLFLYDFEQGTDLELPGTHTPYQPFFSPDGESVAFFDNFNLVKVSVHGGTRVNLAPIKNSRGGVWGPDGTIVYAANNIDKLLGIPSEGGTPTDLTKSASQFTSHRWPQFLPDGKTVLFTSSARNEQSNRGSLFTVSLETGEMKKILDGGFDARYLSSGHLVYAIFGGLMAIPFDLERLETTGTPRRVLDDLRTNNDILFAYYDVSDDGFLTYLPGEAGESLRQPLWIDLDGREEAIDLEADLFGHPAISPDGSRVAITKGGNIHVFDVSRGSLPQFTFEKAGNNIGSQWSADGTEIFFSSSRDRESNAAYNVYHKSSDGSGQAVRISTGATSSYAAYLSSDGKTLFFYTALGPTGFDIWEMPLTGKGEPKPLLQTRFNEGPMKLSPDGNWMAYSSDESGHFEVYVRRYPDMSGKWQVSIDGGADPLWAPDMSAMYYRGEGNVMAVDLDTSESFRAGQPYSLFEDRYVHHLGYSYDLSPDGKRFLMLKQVDYVANSDGEQLKAVTNWFEELKRLVPVDGI